GLPDVMDAERLRHDPVLRACLAPESGDRLPGPLAGKSTLHRFLTRILTLRPNRRVLWRGLVDSALYPLLARFGAGSILSHSQDFGQTDSHFDRFVTAPSRPSACFSPILVLERTIQLLAQP